MKRHLHLLVPGLLDTAALTSAEPVDIEALEWLLTLAERKPQPQTEIPDLVWQQAGQTGPVPVAALAYRYDLGSLPPGPVLRADPVCLEADRDCVRLVAGSVPDLALEDARQLIDAINVQFSDEPWQLVMGPARRWYLLLEEAAGIVTHPPEPAQGHDIHGFMPTGERQRYWRSIINEIQMLMFASPVNLQRQSEGRLSANSLWLWGEGIAPPMIEVPWVVVYSGDPVVAGLGLQAGLPVIPCPAGALELLDTDLPAGQILCQPQLQGGSQGLLAFNHDWALPLYKALQRNLSGAQSKHQLASVNLLTANGVSYELSAGKQRWWRRRRKLGCFLE